MATQRKYELRSRSKSSHEREPLPSSSSQQQKPKKKRVLKKEKGKVDLCQRFSKTIEDLLVSCPNEEFKSQCLSTLGVKNAHEARELAVELKESRKKKSKKNKNDSA